MKTTKRLIKERLINNEEATYEEAQSFVDNLFPGIDMDEIVETTDEDMEDEAHGNVGDTYYA